MKRIKCSDKAHSTLKKQAIDKGMTFFKYMDYVAKLYDNYEDISTSSKSGYLINYPQFGRVKPDTTFRIYANEV